MANLQVIDNAGGENQLSEEEKTFWNTNLLDELHPFLVVEQFAETELNIPQGQGQIAQWHRFTPLAAKTTPLTEGADPAGDDLGIDVVTSTPAEFGGLIKASERLVATSFDDIMLKSQALQGRQIGLTRDSLLQTTILAGTNVIYSGSANTDRDEVAAGDLIDTADLDTAILNLINRSVPFMTSFINPTTGVATVTGLPAYVGLVNSDTWDLIRTLTGVETVDKYQAGNQILPGEVGKYRHIRFCMTTSGFSFAAAGTGGIDVHALLVFGPGAYGSTSIEARGPRPVVKLQASPDSGDKLARLRWVGWKMDFGRVILDDDRIERIEFAIA